VPPSVDPVGIDPGMDECDEIIHDMSDMMCRLAADVDAVDFEGVDEDIFWTDLSSLMSSKTMMVNFMISV
jgi:hypothetical protein